MFETTEAVTPLRGRSDETVEELCTFLSLHTELVAHALCFLEARWILSVACSCRSMESLFSLRLFLWSRDKKQVFRRHWLEAVEAGDRVDAQDVEGRWFEADVLHGQKDELLVHYRSWNSSFDQTFDRTSSRLAPLFTHCCDWRPRLKRGQLIEAKRERAWYLAVVLKVKFNDRRSRWTRLEAVGVKSSRDHDTLRVVSPNFPQATVGGSSSSSSEQPSPFITTTPARTPDVLTWRVTDYDSEDIAPLGTHIRPGEVGKHYTTNSIVMPMSFLIDIMSQP